MGKAKNKVKIEKKDYNRKKIWIVDAVVLCFLLFLDQIVKYLTIVNLKDKPAFVIWEDVFELQYLENRGSAFGMMQNQKIFLLFVGFVFMAVLLYLIIKLPQKHKFLWAHFAITLLIAGGVGNMIDRFRFDFVVDLFSFVLIKFPIFNVADIYICCATGLLLILFFFVYKEDDLSFLKFRQNKYREIK